MLRDRPGDCPAVEQLQGVQRSAAGVYEKLCRTDLQNRISDLHEVVPKEINRDQVHITSMSATITGLK
jgi:hypothetical protein